MAIGGEKFGYRFGSISFVNVIQMLTETFCYHALGFTNIYGITLCTSDGVYDVFSGTAEIVLDGNFTFGTTDDVGAVSEFSHFYIWGDDKGPWKGCPV